MCNNQAITQILRYPSQVHHKLPCIVYQSEEESFKNLASYSTPAVLKVTYLKCWVSPSSIAYKNYRVVKESLLWDISRAHYQVNHLFRKLFYHKRKWLEKDGHFLLVTNAWSSNHYHWICEVLPKILCLGFQTKDYTLLLPDTQYIRSVGIDSLMKMNIIFKNIVLMKENEFYFVQKLSIITPVAKTGGFLKDVMEDIRSRLGTTCSTTSKRIYISRKNATRRRILNEERIESILKDFGFDIVHLEDMSLNDQIQLFKNCNYLIGLHGAGLTNVVFMNSGSCIVEFRKQESERENVLFWHLSDIMGQQYYYINGNANSDKPIIGSKIDIAIPDDILTDLLKKTIQ